MRRLGIRPAPGGDHVGIDKRQVCHRLQEVSNVGGFSGAVRPSKEMEDRHLLGVCLGNATAVNHATLLVCLAPRATSLGELSSEVQVG